MPGTLKRIVTLILLVSLFCTSAYPETFTVIQESRKEENNGYYQKGLELAKKECFCPGSLATGFIVGFSLPFIAVGSAALAYQTTNGCTPCGVVAAFTMPVLTIWGGHRLNSNYSVSMPAEYRRDMKDPERISFSSGYDAGKRLKRNKQYKLGITVGILSFAGTVFYIMYRLRDENLAPGV